MEGNDLLQLANYEEYIDTYLLSDDIRYIRNIMFARMLVELGYRSMREIYSQQKFELNKQSAYEMMFPSIKTPIIYSDKCTSYDPVLVELKMRERANFQRVLATIIFVSKRLKSGFDVSGYIDFQQSLKMCNTMAEDHLDWAEIFDEKQTITPQASDLSFYNWRSSQVCQNDSENFAVVNDPSYGLLFMHKGDRKMICVDPLQEKFQMNAKRTMAHSDKFGHVIFYDHIIRRKI